MSRTGCLLALCLIAQAAFHTSVAPDKRPPRSVARSESALEQRIARDVFVPGGAEVHIHHMELDGNAPEEVIVEVRCDPLTECTVGEVSYSRDDHDLITLPAHAAFYIYGVAKAEQPTSYTARPLLGHGYSHLERAAPSELGHGVHHLVMTSYILYGDANHTDEFGQIGGRSFRSRYTLTSGDEYIRSSSAPSKYGIMPELYLGGSHEPLIGLSAYTTGFRRAGGAISRPESYDKSLYSEDKVIQLLAELLKEPPRNAYRAGLFMQLLQDVFEREDDPLSSHEARLLVEQIQSRLMTTYDSYRSRGYLLPPLMCLEDNYFSEKAWHRMPSVESFFMWFILEGLSWPTSEHVNAWARDHRDNASSPEELAIMIRLVQDSTPEPFRKGLAATDYEEALDKLEQAASRHNNTRGEHYAYAMSGAEQMHDQYMDRCILFRSTCGLSSSRYDEACVQDVTDQTRAFLKSLMSRNPARFVDLLERDVWREDALYVLAHSEGVVTDELIMRSLTRKPEDLMWKGTAYDVLLAQLPARVTENFVRSSSHTELVHMVESWRALLNDNRAMIRSPNRELFESLQLALITSMRELADRYDRRDLELDSRYRSYPRVLLNSLYHVHDVLPTHEYDAWLQRVRTLYKGHDDVDVEMMTAQLDDMCEALVHYRWDARDPVMPLLTSDELDRYLQRIIDLYDSSSSTKLSTDDCDRLDDLPRSYFTPHQYALVEHIVVLATLHNQ